MSMYGEPWKHAGYETFTHGDEYPIISNELESVVPTPEYQARIVSCVNALAGIPDPAGFVKEATAIIRLFAHRDAGFEVDTLDLTRRTNDFLASVLRQPTPT